MKNDFAKHLTGFFTEYLSGERGASHHTIRSYSNTFTQFLDFMNGVKHVRAEKLTIEYLTRDSVLSFLQWIGDTKKCSTSTRNQRLAAIHAFCKYLQYEDVIHLKQWQDVLSIKFKMAAKTSVNYLDVDGIKLLLSQIPTNTIERGVATLP